MTVQALELRQSTLKYPDGTGTDQRLVSFLQVQYTEGDIP